MPIAEDTKIIYLVNGNDGLFRQRLHGLSELPNYCAVWIVYTSKIPATNEKMISDIAAENPLVSVDRFRKSKKAAIQNRFAIHINNIHNLREDIQIVLVSGRYSAPKMLTMESRGMFTYAESIGEYEPDTTTKTGRDVLLDIPPGGPMYILIDYENVGMPGLVGTDCLCKDDSVVLFFSIAAPGIERQYLSDMENRAGHFEAVKLKNIGKNGLDFYIAVRVGQILEANPDTKILIVTRDAGYHAISQYCDAYTKLKYPLVIEESVEMGMAILDGKTERRKQIIERRKKVSIETAYASYEEQQKVEDRIADAFEGTEYEDAVDEIVDLIHETESPRERYLSALRVFGRKDGAEIYRIIKEIMLQTDAI